ncbi:MAG: hypothetical protein AB8I08_21245 [Sandaracinaceae bacterium]
MTLFAVPSAAPRVETESLSQRVHSLHERGPLGPVSVTTMEAWLSELEGVLKTVSEAEQGVASDIASMAFGRIRSRGDSDEARAMIVSEMRGALRVLFAELKPAEASLTAEADIDIARQARARVSQMRRGLGRERPESLEGLTSRLRRFGNALARALGEGAFRNKVGQAGIEELRRLQSRVLNELRMPTRLSATRLWQDCYSTSALLVIERSPDVAQADREELLHLRRRLRQQRRLTRGTLKRFKALRGVEEGLDELIECGEPDPQVWLDRLQKVVAEETG